MTDFAAFHLKPALRERHALLDVGYPVPIARVMELLTNGSNVKAVFPTGFPRPGKWGAV